ncbi:DHH family phosphoesterase [bacterium]|nr:DHH family phosphoesterase [bacterium]
MIKQQIPPIIKEILLARGFESETDMVKFLFSGIPSLTDPFSIPVLKNACDTLKKTILNGEKVFVFGDGDVDGICGVFLILSFFRDLGIKIPFYLTHRLEDNYEIPTSLISELKENGFSTLITVDCGISSVEALKKAEQLGLKCIILDHHIMEFPDKLPKSHIYVNPNCIKWNKDFSYLSGTGVVFKFITGMEQLMSGLREKRISKMYEIPCLAALADIVPLVGENRIFVKEGLRKLPFTSIKGLNYLLDFYRLKPTPTIRDIVMRLNPKLNSPGRLGKPEIVLELLLENDISLIEKIANEIDANDRERYRAITKIMKTIENCDDIEKGFIISDDDYRGLSGIIASRLAGKFERPFVVCYKKDDFIRGSIRTPDGYLLHSLKSNIEEFMDEIGGHSQAVGFKCSSTKIDIVKDIWDSTEWHFHINKQYDCELDIDKLTPSLIEDIFTYLEPFGKGNPLPIFLCRNITIKTIRADEPNTKKCWVKNKNSFFEATLPEKINIPQPDELSDIYYTPYVRSFNGLYRIILKISNLTTYSSGSVDC